MRPCQKLCTLICVFFVRQISWGHKVAACVMCLFVACVIGSVFSLCYVFMRAWLASLAYARFARVARFARCGRFAAAGSPWWLAGQP